jgi:hypothetical protein
MGERAHGESGYQAGDDGCNEGRAMRQTVLLARASTMAALHSRLATSATAIPAATIDTINRSGNSHLGAILRLRLIAGSFTPVPTDP